VTWPPTDLAHWRGSAVLGIGFGVFHGQAGDNTSHAHHAIQLVLSSAAIGLWVDGPGWLAAQGLVVAANVRHRIAPSTQQVTLIYIEPDSATGRMLAGQLANGWRVLGTRQTQAVLSELAQEPAALVVRAVCRALQLEPESSTSGHDVLIARVLERLPRPLPENLSAASLAAKAGLSVSRFQHRFRGHTGMALRPYLRWLRLLTAFQCIGSGMALTAASAEAGFADAPHFSRTCRRHFGIAPKQLLQLRFSRPAKG
jgi:AraC-like DNA-binding protein